MAVKSAFSRYNSLTTRPIIRRTRSWRGIMQVRFNDTRADRNKLGRQAFFWAPVRIFGLGLLVTCCLYMGMGHDSFIHNLLGYESEMQYEARVNPVPEDFQNYMVLDSDRAWKSPLRNLEKPLHPNREFDVLRDPKST
ncbi:putative mitochondrial hypothetical protein [Leptomonas pyrrhocoris]|uniref:Uncharacterized protein n=1 Tax=Leptomonas pyrrhocoris TaxID=157538 RepID=A0A0M9G1P8_LEPPY|nr:putative mitochondrial hypothetical protein [Leptomonas pyrrhocoris]KPA80379.1 putative mitochondrial hypothetical protein [Leptomonas pyrrhocoris]|eukprot:XP_015658818.1 putative mitochondrial hypothetical protein [Leptomonas pyrrhocoris]